MINIWCLRPGRCLDSLTRICSLMLANVILYAPHHLQCAPQGARYPFRIIRVDAPHFAPQNNHHHF